MKLIGIGFCEGGGLGREANQASPKFGAFGVTSNTYTPGVPFCEVGLGGRWGAAGSGVLAG